MIKKSKLIELYERYGFTLEDDRSEDGVLVFSISNGYFSNVDIVPWRENAISSNVFEEYKSIGYACKIRTYEEAASAEKLLFNGFFAIDNSKNRMLGDYKRFASSIVEPFDKGAEYKYLNVPYWINGVEGDRDLVCEVMQRLNEERPLLFLIEAAAGFGKTCTAHELVNEIIKVDEKIPLFAELSRNRQARIFKYILLDEIDRSFSQLNSRLVQKEILNGRVVVVLDGFDELLRESGDGDSDEFENKEPMLETIGEYLRGSAKVILTTRRTILFDDDEFHRWLDKNKEVFDVVKIRIGEPRIKDWLSEDRLSVLRDAGLELDYLANPVLLSYLRCIPFEKFQVVASDSEKLVASYFDFMLEREMQRQELLLDVEKQHKVLASIASDMISLQYISEDRDYIVSLILEEQCDLIDEMINCYPAAMRPTREVVANKLASHALLDKSSRNPNKIGFINDFVLGNYVAENIVNSESWLNDDWRFLEVATSSYQSRGRVARGNLHEKLQETMDFLTYSQRIEVSSKLIRRIGFPLISGSADSLTIENVEIGEQEINQFQFNECVFKKCIFNLNNIVELTLLNCTFFNCSVDGVIGNGKVYILGANGDYSHIVEAVVVVSNCEQEFNDLEQEEKYVLERFWPVGREKISHKHRPIKGICIRSGDLTPERIFQAINSLRKKGILLEPNNPSFVEINFEMINEIKNIVGR